MDYPNFLLFAEDVVFLQPKKIINEISEGSTSVNRAQGSLSFHPNVLHPTFLAGYREDDTGPPPSQRRQHPAPVQFPLQIPQQMGVGGPTHMPVNSASISRRFRPGRFGPRPMVARNSGKNYDSQAAYSSSSRNVEEGDFMNTGTQIPPHLSPHTSFSGIKSDLKQTDPMDTSNPSTTSNLSPYNNAIQQAEVLEASSTHPTPYMDAVLGHTDSRSNPFLAPHMNEPDMVNFVSTNRNPTTWEQSGESPPPYTDVVLGHTDSHSNSSLAPYMNEPDFVSTNRNPTIWKQSRESSPPALTSSLDYSSPSLFPLYSPALFPSLPSDGPNPDNISYRGLTDHSVDHTDIDSFPLYSPALFSLPSVASDGPNPDNIYYRGLTDHSVDHTNIDSFNEHNNTIQDSFKHKSFVDSTGKHPGMFFILFFHYHNWTLKILSIHKLKITRNESDVPITARKKKNSAVKPCFRVPPRILFGMPVVP
jgi:hypothetical protein